MIFGIVLSSAQLKSPPRTRRTRPAAPPAADERSQVWPERSLALLSCDALRPEPSSPAIPAEVRRRRMAESRSMRVNRTPLTSPLFDVGELDEEAA